jgi:hypothetical protein
MRIYACGCSFTYGDELASPDVHAWPAVLANKLNASVVNDAKSGGTNARTVYRTIKHSQNEYDLYLIAWTDYSRFTFYKSDNNFETNFNTQLVHTLYSTESFYKDWGNTLYNHWYNELYAFKLWLQQIVQLQNVLSNKNYLMINTMSNNLSNWTVEKAEFINSVKHLINFNGMTDDQIFDEYNEIQYYISLIDYSKFYKWNKFFITQLSKQFKRGPGGHILEDGHKHLAELIYTHIQTERLLPLNSTQLTQGTYNV